MNVGVGQTGNTCWLYSSLNMFLTSDNGLKIMWQKLQEVYPKLKPREKAYFNSNINAPCPYKGSVKKTSAIYFWKFLNEYMCAIGGPGRLIPKSGLNAYLTKNIKWRLPSTRESKGTTGSFPHMEIPVILGHLGFRIGHDFRMLDFNRWRYKFKNNSWTTPILMYSAKGTFPMRDILLEKRGYDLTGAIVYVKPAIESTLDPHVWACSIRNGKGYICDSNYPLAQVECKWWLKENLERFFMTVSPNYRPGRARNIGFDVILYTRKEFTNKIAPRCQLPKSYKPLTAENENLVNQGNIFANYFRKGNVGNLHKNYPPRIRAEIIRRNAAKPVVTPAMYAKLANEAGSYNHGMRMLRSLRNAQGVEYKINRNGPNFLNYSKKLIAKFPQPIPKHMWNFFWRNASSNKNFVNTVRKWAVKAGYAVNENQLNRIIATRAKTRAGTKRAEERIYRAGNNWYNNKGNNVTAKINPANWVLNETPNRSIELAVANLKNYNGNVKTYRRK